MRKLICIRHGESIGGHLSIPGQLQMMAVAKVLRPYLGSFSVIILSSSATRAKESAEVLCRELGINDFEICSELWSDVGHPQVNKPVFELVEQQESDVVVLLTHQEYANCFPTYYARELGLGDVPYRSLDNGEAVVLDLEECTVTHIFSDEVLTGTIQKPIKQEQASESLGNDYEEDDEDYESPF